MNILILLPLMLLSAADAQDLKHRDVQEFQIEFAEILNNNQQEFIKHRPKASNGQTLRIVDPDRTSSIRIHYCAQPAKGKEVKLSAVRLRYSNAKGVDSVHLFSESEGKRVEQASFNTVVYEGKGNGWNSFIEHEISSEKPRLKQKGYYTTVIEVQTDPDGGVEFDTFVAEVENQDPDVDLFCRPSFEPAKKQTSLSYLAYSRNRFFK